MLGNCFMGRRSCLHELGDNLVSLVRRGCWLGLRALRGGGVTFRPGRRPRMSVQRPWSMSSFPCAAWAAGGWVVRRCGSSASGGTSGRRSRKVVCELRVLVSRGRWASCGSSSGGLTSSSLERPVFAPPIAFTPSFSRALGWGRLVLVGWCCVGFAPIVSVLVRFSVNLPGNSLLLN
jgi:hypothetical protein